MNRQVLLNLKECDKFYFSCKCCFPGQEYFIWTSYLFWTSATSIGQVLPLLARCYLYWSSVTSLSGKRYCYWTCATATSIGQVFPLYWTSATAIGHVLPLLVKRYFYRDKRYLLAHMCVLMGSRQDAEGEDLQAP